MQVNRLFLNGKLPALCQETSNVSSFLFAFRIVTLTTKCSNILDFQQLGATLLWTLSWSEHKYSNCCCDHDWNQTFSCGHTTRIRYECPLKWAIKQCQRAQRGHWGGSRAGWVMDPRMGPITRSPAWCWKIDIMHASQMQHKVGHVDESHYTKMIHHLRAVVILRSFKDQNLPL